VILAIATAVTVAFTVVIAKGTRPLERLTAAAGEVAEGNLSPTLPRGGGDEVGTLSTAFDHMLGRVRSMMREVEVSRQLAVLGEFSAQLSHEIRNPLTSLKLNLQGLARDVRRGKLPESASQPLETCLREVHRLDNVVRGVLELAKPRESTRAPVAVHALLERVVDLHASRLSDHDIVVTRELRADHDVVEGAETQLVGMLTNLLVNAADAQPHGGRIHLRTSSGDSRIEIVIADDGPGVPPHLAEDIFRPFVTGRATGTGLGLPMALAVARDHGGTLDLVPSPGTLRGAAFRVTLPLA
jgi:signal transduction histidine kinase